MKISSVINSLKTLAIRKSIPKTAQQDNYNTESKKSLDFYGFGSIEPITLKNKLNEAIMISFTCLRLEQVKAN